jgi:taurine dioxygenase
MKLAEVVDGRAGTDAGPPFQVERVTATLGAEVSGIDLSGPLSARIIDAISAALVRHRVLFFRDQAITVEQHLAFGRRFGPLEVHPFNESLKGFANDGAAPEVIVIESTAERPIAADQWHSDVSFRAEPSLGSILRCRITPDAGGDTLWADMAAAYEGLDDATRRQISGLTAVHDWETFRRGMRAHGVSEDRIAQLQARHPPAEHPLVRTHPVSGEKILYVNATFTVGVKGMKEAESRPLLERLCRQAHIPDYQVRFRWRPDSIAFWDNRGTQHYATRDFFPAHRRMERVTVAGDRPF